jgi:hypothetical protein
MAYLDEAFGGLVRQGYIAPEDVGRRLEIVAGGGYRYTKLAIERYMRQAHPLKVAAE